MSKTAGLLHSRDGTEGRQSWAVSTRSMASHTRHRTALRGRPSSHSADKCLAGVALWVQSQTCHTRDKTVHPPQEWHRRIGIAVPDWPWRSSAIYVLNFDRAHPLNLDHSQLPCSVSKIVDCPLLRRREKGINILFRNIQRTKRLFVRPQEIVEPLPRVRMRGCLSATRLIPLLNPYPEHPFHRAGVGIVVSVRKLVDDRRGKRNPGLPSLSMFLD